MVLVLDNGPIHTSKVSTAALGGHTWLWVEWLAKYAPERNAIARDGRHLRVHYLATQVFLGEEHLDQRIHFALSQIDALRAQHCRPN